MPTTPTASGPIVEYQNTPTSNGQQLPIFNQFLPIREVTTNDEINAHNLYRSVNLLETVFNMQSQGNFVDIFDDRDFTDYRRRPFFGMGANFNNSNNIIQNPVASVSHINPARSNINALASYLGVSRPASLSQQVTTNSIVRAQHWNDVILTARDCWEHRFDGLKTATVVDGPTVSTTEIVFDTSGHPVTHGISFRFNFSSVENMLRFFVVGGAIGLQLVSPQTPYLLWNDLFNLAGDRVIRLSAFQVNVNEYTSVLDSDIRDNYRIDKSVISDPISSYTADNIMTRGGNRRFYRIRGWGPGGPFRRLELAHLRVLVGVYNDNGYASILLEVNFFDPSEYLNDGIGRSVTAKVWQPNTTLASFLPNFENPTITSYPDSLSNIPTSSSFRQP